MFAGSNEPVRAERTHFVVIGGVGAALRIGSTRNLPLGLYRPWRSLRPLRHGVVLRSQAASFGLTSPELRIAKERGWLTEPARGVLVVSGYPATWEQRLAIVTAAGTARPLVSNGASARLFTLDGFGGADAELTVLRPGRISSSSPTESWFTTPPCSTLWMEFPRRFAVHDVGPDTCRPRLDRVSGSSLAGADLGSSTSPCQPTVAPTDGASTASARPGGNRGVASCASSVELRRISP